jgi:YbbR domain-containing protein
MREGFLSDWPLKLLALVLAFAIWASITGQDRTLRDLVVPLEVEFGTERIASSPPPTQVTVRLEGPQTTVRKLDPLSFGARLDLSEAPLGEREVPLTASDLTGVPRGVEVSLFDPDRVRLVLVERAQREVEIVPELVGQPAEGRALYGFVVSPQTVMVDGPLSAVDAIDRLRTESIPLEDHTDPFLASVGLVPEAPQVRVLDVDEVEVQVLVDAAAVDRAFDDLPVALPYSPEGTARIRPANVRVVLSGPPWLIESIEPTQLSAVAETDEQGPGRARRVPVRIELLLPDEHKRLVTVRSVKPDEISIQIQESS